MYFSTSSRSVVSSASDRSRVRLLSMPVSLRIALAVVGPTPKMYCSEASTRLALGISTPAIRAATTWREPRRGAAGAGEATAGRAREESCEVAGWGVQMKERSAGERKKKEDDREQGPSAR